MSVKERVLDALQALVLEGDPAPPLDAVAARADVSKGGLLHHFPDRRSMVTGLILRAIDRTDAVMTEAARAGTAAATWIRMSAMAGPSQESARALLALLRLTGAGRIDLPADVATAMTRWQDLITAEVGDPVLGEVVRLVGDGLFLEAVVGTPPDQARIDALSTRLLIP